MEYEDRATREKMQTDPMFKLERIQEALEKAQDEKARTKALQGMMKDRSDAYSINSALRKRFRDEKKARLEEEKPKNFAIPLLPPDRADVAEAMQVAFRTSRGAVARHLQ